MVAVCYSSSSPRPIVVLVVVVLLPPLVHVVPASSAAGVYACYGYCCSCWLVVFTTTRVACVEVVTHT
jgi:hypothetical protein